MYTEFESASSPQRLVLKAKPIGSLGVLIQHF
jgi:hypothetical protein